MTADSADVIIVGAGSAGCVLAARLSEDRSRRVLLLEAGGPDTTPHVRVPVLFPRLFNSPRDWAYSTVPQPRLAGRCLFWPRGKMLGGCSSMNAMLYVRGHPADYDGWAADGCPGWSSADVLPLFRRSERHHAGPSPFHGGDGPLCVNRLRCVNPLSRAFVEAGVAAGLPRNDDFNGPRPDGVGLYEVTQNGGRRHSAAAAFLRPVLDRPNLTVLTHTHATRILFAGNRTVGVEFVRDGVRRTARSAEVVLCGGAVNSPQLLLLSGIGPADDLRRLGLPTVADVPGVGANLQDHPVVGAAWGCRRPVSLLSAKRWWHVLRFILWGGGPLTSSVAEAGAFVRSRPELPTPDLQFHFVPALVHDHGRREPTSHGFLAGVTLVRPFSRGRVTLASADPLAPPRIDPCYLADERDTAALVAGLRLAREIVRQPPFDPYRGNELAPGPTRVADAHLADHLRHGLETLYHPVGTCRMGRGAEAVVGPDLRVRGVAGLRVADASVMPTIPAGNTNAPTIMIGERAADLMIAGRD